MATNDQRPVEHALTGELKGITVMRAENGDLTFDVSAFGDVHVQVKTGVSNHILTQSLTEKQINLQHGDITEGGWVYIGVDDGNDIFAKGYGLKQWKDAMEFAANKAAHLASDNELDLLQENIINGVIKNKNAPKNKRDGLKGIFDVSGAGYGTWVWGSCENLDTPNCHARQQRLSDGLKMWGWKGENASTLLFRSGLKSLES